MVKLCSMSMASVGKPSGFVLHQEQGMSKVFKDCVHLLPSPGVGRDATRSGFLNLRPCQFEELWRPVDQLFESNKCVKIDSMVKRPVFIDAKVPTHTYRAEIKDLISFLDEIYSPKDLAICKKQSYSLDSDEAHAIANPSSPKIQAVTAASTKSPEKLNPTMSKKKKKSDRKKPNKERDLQRKNSSHAFESLLSLIANRKQHGKSVIHSLKTSGPELPNLLTQFSAGIAGTGMAVVFSIIGRVASGRVPLCASKLVNTGFGFGLVWLAWAVNGLRDTIVSIRKNSRKNSNSNSNKTGLKEEERLRKVDSSVKVIYFRAATLMVLAILKLA